MSKKKNSGKKKDKEPKTKRGNNLHSQVVYLVNSDRITEHGNVPGRVSSFFGDIMSITPHSLTL